MCGFSTYPDVSFYYTSDLSHGYYSLVHGHSLTIFPTSTLPSRNCSVHSTTCCRLSPVQNAQGLPPSLTATGLPLVILMLSPSTLFFSSFPADACYSNGGGSGTRVLNTLSCFLLAGVILSKLPS